MGAEVVSCKNAHRCQCVAQPDIDDGVLLQESVQNCIKCGVLIANVTPVFNMLMRHLWSALRAVPRRVYHRLYVGHEQVCCILASL